MTEFYQRDIGTKNRPINTLHVKKVNFNGILDEVGLQGQQGLQGPDGPEGSVIFSDPIEFVPQIVFDPPIPTAIKANILKSVVTSALYTVMNKLVTLSFTVEFQRGTQSNFDPNDSLLTLSLPLVAKSPEHIKYSVTLGKCDNLIFAGGLTASITGGDSFMTFHRGVNLSGSLVDHYNIHLNNVVPDVTCSISGSVQYFTT